MLAKNRTGYGLNALAMGIVLNVAAAAYAQPQLLMTTVIDGGTVIVADGDVIDLGDVRSDEQVLFLFQVHDQGDGNLFLNNVRVVSQSDNVVSTRSGFSSIAGQFAADAGFTANEPGPAEIEVEITSNDPTGPFSFVLRADVLASRLLITNGLDLVDADSPLELAPVDVGQSGGAALTIRNLGTANLNFTAAQVTDPAGGNPDDLAVNLPNSIVPGGFGVMTLAFAPTIAGPRAFEVEVSTDDPAGPYTFTVLAEGLEPAIDDCNFNGTDDATDLAAGTSTDCDFDGQPDECETDGDGDGVIDDCDQCPGADDNLDTDGDGAADCLDNCPATPNPDQQDTDGNGIGDACEEIAFDDCNTNGRDDVEDLATGDSTDCNTDGVPDECQQLDDRDADGVADGCDNCPDQYNPFQVDRNDDGIGDVCDEDNDLPRVEIPDVCGAGALAVIPVLMLGMCGMRTRGRHEAC